MQVYFISPGEADTVWKGPVPGVLDEFEKELGPLGARALDIIQRARR